MKRQSMVTIKGKTKLRIPMQLKVFLKSGKVLSYYPKMRSSVRARVKAVPRKNVIKYYLKVTYGRALDNFDKMTTFDNEGEWETKGELYQAMRAFTERDLLREWL